MKKKFLALVLLTVLIVCPIISACGAPSEADDGKLTFYCVGEYGDNLVDFIKKYNKYCAVNDCFEDSVEFVEFENFDEMNDALSTELMAGKGPDILSLNQKLPFEKLVRNNSLADIDQILKEANVNINFDEYNKTIMDGGVINGKRVIVPLYFSANVLHTTEERLNELGIYDGNADKNAIIEKFRESDTDMYLFNPWDAEYFYFNFIRQYIDFNEGKTYFDTEEFRENAEALKADMLKSASYYDLAYYEGKDTENHSDYLFSGLKYCFYGGSLTDFMRVYYSNIADGVSPVCIPDYNKNGEVTANIEIGFGINANCKKTDKAAKFIEYLLSDASQSYFAGARIDNDLVNGMSLPVKTSVFEDAVTQAMNYNWNYSEVDFETDEKIKAIREEACRVLTDEYLPIIESISSCSFYGFHSLYDTYIYRDIAGEIIVDYMDDKITTDKFAEKLTASFNLYMNE